MMRFFVICLIVLFGAAFAIVPLGASVAPEVRQGLTGAYFIAFVSPTCLTEQTRVQHWGALEMANVLRVDAKAVSPPVLPGQWRFLKGQAAANLTTELKVRTLPTTVLVDRDNRIRAVFEGVLEKKWVLEKLADYGQ
jgi:hypothetical protein